MRLLRIIVSTILFLGSFCAFASGDPERGEPLTLVCSACHGVDGNSPMGTFPNIAGQNQEYLLKQLREIKSGARAAMMMTGILDNLDDQQLSDIAAFYSQHEEKIGQADPELVGLGESIYRAGIKRKKVAACAACHSPDGSGNGPAGFPMLRGQWPDYTIAQLQAFRSGQRHNDGDSRMMRLTAMDLSDQEIEALASYLHGLH